MLVPENYLNRTPIYFPNSNTEIILVGCGGTGSWLIPHLFRLVKLYQKKGINTALTLFDPDFVEERNCDRQNFAPAEIGKNKAETIALRYNLSLGCEAIAYPEPFTAKKLMYQVDRRNYLIIGCVDQIEGRASIVEHFKQFPHKTEYDWYLDCGNHFDTGQVLIGNSLQLQIEKYPKVKLTQSIPLPTIQHPELLQADQNPNPISCEEQQNTTINQIVASIAADYVFQLYQGTLTHYATYIDLDSGITQSKYA